MSIKRKYLPRFEGAIEGYVVNFTRTNLWRVQSSMEFEDVIQEAHVVFLRLASKYGLTDTPQHFMALFKTAWTNHFTDLSRTDSSLRLCVLDSQMVEDEDGTYSTLMDSLPGDLENCGYLHQLLEEAPADIRTVLSFFFNAPDHLVEKLTAAWKQAGRRDDGGNTMLCETLGFPRGTDVVARVSQYFKP